MIFGPQDRMLPVIVGAVIAGELTKPLMLGSVFDVALLRSRLWLTLRRGHAQRGYSPPPACTSASRRLANAAVCAHNESARGGTVWNDHLHCGHL